MTLSMNWTRSKRQNIECLRNDSKNCNSTLGELQFFCELNRMMSYFKYAMNNAPFQMLPNPQLTHPNYSDHCKLFHLTHL